MKNKDYENFRKRYDKFKKYNLPTPFFDDERQTREYIWFNNSNDNELKENVTSTLSYAMEEIAFTQLYYSFNCRSFNAKMVGNKYVTDEKIGHNHAHSFEEVLELLYDFPESFKISKKDEIYYSRQELMFLRDVQKYLQFIGLKDIKWSPRSNSRYRNSKQKKYGNAYIHSFKNSVIKNIENGKRNFKVIHYIKGYKPKIYKNGEFKALITNEKGDFKFFVEFTHEEIKNVKEIRKVYKNKSISDNDKVIVCYFKILEKF